MKKLFAALALAAVVAPVWAATQTVTLSVPGMTCSTCPITVKKAISKVEGVSKIDVTFETREAVVTFDDAKGTAQVGIVMRINRRTATLEAMDGLQEGAASAPNRPPRPPAPAGP